VPTSHVQSLADMMSDILSLNSSDLCMFKKLTVFVLKTYRPGIKKQVTVRHVYQMMIKRILSAL